MRTFDEPFVLLPADLEAGSRWTSQYVGTVVTTNETGTHEAEFDEQIDFTARPGEGWIPKRNEASVETIHIETSQRVPMGVFLSNRFEVAELSGLVRDFDLGIMISSHSP